MCPGLLFLLSVRPTLFLFLMTYSQLRNLLECSTAVVVPGLENRCFSLQDLSQFHSQAAVSLLKSCSANGLSGFIDVCADETNADHHLLSSAYIVFHLTIWYKKKLRVWIQSK